MNLFLSIKAITLYEKLTSSPFSKYTNTVEQAIPLLYCILVSHPENDFHLTYEQAVSKYFSDEKTLNDLSLQLQQQLIFQNQFLDVDKNTEENVNENKEESKDNDSAIYIKNIIPALLDCGLSIDYVMNEMQYTDIELYLKYREDKRREELIEKRLFTYINISPHIDHKKCKSPESLLPLPWEKEEKIKKFKKEEKDITQKLKDLGIIKGKTEK